jgi:hypothetical protein
MAARLEGSGRTARSGILALSAPVKGGAMGSSNAAHGGHAPTHHQRKVNPSTGPVIRTFSKTGLSDI